MLRLITGYEGVQARAVPYLAGDSESVVSLTELTDMHFIKVFLLFWEQRRLHMHHIPAHKGSSGELLHGKDF